MDILDLPELLLNVLSFVKADPRSFTRCMRANKRWREIAMENAQQLLEDNIYALCQGAVVTVGCPLEPFEFRVPGYQAQLLAIAGAIECKDDKLSFRSRDIAEHWWKTTRRYVEKEPQNRPSPLTIVDWDGNDRSVSFAGGRIMAPIVRPETGQLWFWVWDTNKNRTLDEAKAELLRAFKCTDAHVIVGAAGLGLVGFDGRDRIWFKHGPSHILYGLNETECVTLEAKTRTQAGIPELDRPHPYKEYFHTGEINAQRQPISALDRENRFYISDSIGVHIIHADEPTHFDYFSTYKINYERNIFYEDSLSFYTLYKYVDPTGKLFVWSTPGIFGWSGTVGYWTFDGTKWENVDIVRDIYDVAVRVLKNTRQIWLFKSQNIQVLEEPLSGDAKPVLVPLKELTGMESAYTNRVVARSEDRHESIAFLHSKSFLLDSKNQQREPPALPDNVNALFKTVDLPRVGWGNNTVKDGVIYFSDEKKIVAASIDGKHINSFSCTETLSDPRLLFVLSKPRKYGKPLQMIYLKSGTTTYLLDPTVKFVDFSGVPGMHLPTSDPPPPTPGGFLMFHYNNQAYEWHVRELPRVSSMNLGDSHCNFIHGTGGLLISYNSRARLNFADQVVVENDLEMLADKHYATLVESLPFPPRRPYSAPLIHDGLGNIWVNRSTKLSVRTPKGLIHLATEKHKSSKGYFSVNAMAPLGNGSAIVLVSDYKSLLVTIDQSKKKLKAKPTDLPIGVRYTIYASEWKENVFYDKEGAAYMLSEEWENGMHFKTYCTEQDTKLKVLTGKLLLIDRHGGKWFYQERIQSDAPSVVIYRPYKSTAEFKIEISLNHQTLSEDFLVDHAVWLFVESGMKRVKFNGSSLEITEDLKVVVPSRVRTAAADGRHVLWNGAYNQAGCMVLDEKSFK